MDVQNRANANIANIGGNGDENGVDLEISGNGSDSDNTIDLDLDRSVLVVQENKADIKNGIWADSNTGNNDANDNTDGDVSIDTGDAQTRVEVDNAVNFNAADVDCCLFDVEAEISGNGSGSDNEIEAELENELEVFQSNCGKDNKPENHDLFLDGNQHGDHRGCEVENEVWADAFTGDNKANDNTDGDVETSTGDAETKVEASNSANVNLFGEDVDFDFDFDLDELEDLLSQLLEGLHLSA